MMSETRSYLPEGWLWPLRYTPDELKAAAADGAVGEGLVTRCDEKRDLHVEIAGLRGIIPREEAVSPAVSGAGREIALLSRVGRPTQFMVTSFGADDKGAPLLFLSRRAAQEKALDFLLNTLAPGAVLPARITHFEPFGAFVDVGCGVISLLPTERISVSRIAHPSDRFRPGQALFAAVLASDREQKRLYLTHRELLGTWMENASLFREGETVPGVVRSIKEYGAFIELTPNLSGLAEPSDGLREGDGVSVYIRSIRPEQMKIKLQIIERLELPPARSPLRYQITGGQLSRWIYSPAEYRGRSVETVFTSSP